MRHLHILLVSKLAPTTHVEHTVGLLAVHVPHKLAKHGKHTIFPSVDDKAL